jgi:hypothetical protein
LGRRHGGPRRSTEPYTTSSKWCSANFQRRAWDRAHPEVKVRRLRQHDPADAALVRPVDARAIARATLAAADLEAARL